MSIQLTSFNGEEFHLSDPGFAAMKRLVRANGFATDLDPPLSLSGEEARQLADAFERGLDKLSRLPPRPVEIEEDELADEHLLPHVFTSRSAAHWASFIAFCRRGGLKIGWI